MDPFGLTTLLVLVPGILWASWIDYSQRRVPNWLNGALILAGFTAQIGYHGLNGFNAAAWGLLVGFGLLLVPWLMHGMGAGDVKLMAAIGVWFGPWMTMAAFAVGAVIGGVVAVIMILSSGRLRSALANMNVIWLKVQSSSTLFGDFGSAKSFGNTSQLLPYGVPLTAGSLVILFGQYFNWWAF